LLGSVPVSCSHQVLPLLPPFAGHIEFFNTTGRLPHVGDARVGKSPPGATLSKFRHVPAQGGQAMAYDLLIKNGLIVDGSGMPAFRGDVGIRNGKIAEIGKLSSTARKTIDADGRAVSPGFIDNHCHYDAQVTWDPLCTFSPEHGATSV